MVFGMANLCAPAAIAVGRDPFWIHDGDMFEIIQFGCLDIFYIFV